jgi:hypothetical protein
MKQKEEIIKFFADLSKDVSILVAERFLKYSAENDIELAQEYAPQVICNSVWTCMSAILEIEKQKNNGKQGEDIEERYKSIVSDIDGIYNIRKQKFLKLLESIK